nr:tetratricopeptide repeat protein [Acaryochloris marina]
MSSEVDTHLQMMSAYTKGREAFEHGYYRESVESLVQAIALVNRNSPLDGEMQMWLVTAYQAAGQQQEAISLCRKLQMHGHWETRKQSKRLLYILEAPQLEKKSEWLTQIPDLSEVNEEDVKERMGVGNFSPSVTKLRPTEPEPIDWSQVDTKESNIVWVALIALLLVLGSLVWLG